MKKEIIIIFCMVLMTSFVFAASITSYATADNSNQNQVQANVSSGVNTNSSLNAQIREQERVQSRELSEYEVRTIKRIQNRLHADTAAGNCPENCRCDGSVTRCQLENGSREMIIKAGNSGNTIVQVKEANMTTRVTLYKAQGKIYGEFNGNQTRAIEVLPDEVKERIRERLKQKTCDCEEIELDEEGVYQVQARKRARLFGIIPVRERVRVEMNSETGEIIRTRTSWWGFLARDVVDEESSE